MLRSWRRLSLSIKRVEGQVLPVRPIIPPAEGDVLEDMPELGLSEDVFSDAPLPSDSTVDEAPQPADSADAATAEAQDEVVAEDELPRAAAPGEPETESPAEDEAVAASDEDASASDDVAEQPEA